MKHFNIKDYVDDFKTLPLALVHSFEDSSEQWDIFTNLILECIERHAPVVRTKFTHSPAPWMETVRYSWFTKKARQLSLPSTSSPTEKNWAKFRDVQNELKSKIKETKTAFYKKYYLPKTVKVLKPNDSKLTQITTSLHK